MAQGNGTRKRQGRASFYVVALLLPFLVFGVLELVLRLTATSAQIPLFVPAPVEGYLQPNESVIKRFFAKPDHAPNVSIDTGYFLEEKPEDAIRVVVQGGSTAAGFPYGRMASPAGMLQQRLERAFPGRTVEVINTAMSAVNSFTLLDFADEIIDIEPDAVVIYAGHNEFLGVLGVGSAFSSSVSPQTTRMIMRLRRWRVIEAGFQIYGFALPEAEESTGTLMSRIAGERSIPSGSQMFVTGERQFRENLDLMLAAYRRAKVPVFIGTLASNEKDQRPFVSASPPVAEARAWEFNRDSLLEAAENGDAEGARQAASLLVNTAPESADSWFLQGEAELLGERRSEARHAFLAAKDLDQLRFRAPESFNEIIRDTAVRNGATVVDVQAAFAEYSTDGIIGNELMLEHLHPNADGYFLMGDVFFRAITRDQVGGPPVRIVDETTARREMPVTEIDRLAGGWRVDRLKLDWPFQVVKQPFELPEPETEIERIALDWFVGRKSWSETMNRALGFYSSEGNMEEASRVATVMAAAFPFEPDPAYIAGQTILSLGQGERALPFLHRAARLDPDNTRYLMALAQGFYVDGRIDDSLAVLERVLAIEPNHGAATQFRKKLREERGGTGG